jgi:hypothetical protein
MRISEQVGYVPVAAFRLVILDNFSSPFRSSKSEAVTSVDFPEFGTNGCSVGDSNPSPVVSVKR